MARLGPGLRHQDTDKAVVKPPERLQAMTPTSAAPKGRYGMTMLNHESNTLW